MSEPRTVKGCCPLDCQDTCAWEAHVENGRVTRVVGAAAHPFTRGSLCAKVNDYQERTYAPDRLLHPLRRTGPKGSGQFERVSWNEALDTVASRFLEIIRTHGGEALLPVNYLGSMGILQRHALMRVFHAVGASRFHGSICGAAGNIVASEGHPHGFDPETIVDSRLVLLWGANLLTTGHHHFHFIQEARRRHGARLVMIDPRRTITAKACDEHVSIRPGTDGIFAAGLAQVMFHEGLADLEYAGQVGSDLDAFREQVMPWTPARVGEACGVAPETVTRLAREFAAARPAVIRASVGPQQTVGGEEFVRLLSALAILGGHWKHPGGGLFIEATPQLSEVAAMRRDLILGTPRSLDVARLGEHLTRTELAPPIMGFVVWTMNPVVNQPNAALMERGLAREDLFTLVIENFMTDTARFADVVLPSTTQLEHFDMQGAWGHDYISINNPAIAPLGEARSHADIMRALAPRMGLTDPAFTESDEAILEPTLPPGITVAELRQTGWHKSPRERPEPARAGRQLRLAGGVPLPPTAPRPGMFQLLTPKSHYFMNSSFANMPRQLKAMKRPTLEMNCADAAARGFVNEQSVRLHNERGEITAWLHLTDDIHPGVVSLPGKWWSFPGETGALANRLTPSAWAPGGQPAYNDTFIVVDPIPRLTGKTPS